MTWAQRVGDLATNIALVFINLARIATLLASAAMEKLDGFVEGLSTKSEGNIRPADSAPGTWLRLPASAFWGIAAVVLRVASLATVFARQITATVDDFFRGLAEA